MATVTRLKLGPKDHDRELTYDDFMAADYKPGYKYEIIDGRLYASPLPKAPEERSENWLMNALNRYRWQHPEVLNYVSGKTCVFVLGRPGVTVPEPDIAAYNDYPLELPFNVVRWEDLRPILVAEVLTKSDPKKDLVRNVELYA
jgi:Uma2 family endonuclease